MPHALYGNDRATIMIHDLADARAALTAAKTLDMPVRLTSPSGAPAYLGIDSFQDVVAAAREDFPDVDAHYVLDCDNHTGFALTALRQGVDRIHVCVDDDIRRHIEDIARQLGACLDDSVHPALDLEYANDPVAACQEWLSQPRSEP